MSSIRSVEENRKLLTGFYDCFARGDAEGMVACYADDATFSDPAFGKLNGEEVRCMWRMLHAIAKEQPKIAYGDVQASEHEGSLRWEAQYTFSPTGRSVINRVSTRMEFVRGKVVRHQDSFSFYRWARQALGPAGLLLGWLPITRTLFQKKSRAMLRDYMKSGVLPAA